MKRVAFAVDYPESMAHPIHRGIRDREGVSRGELLMWGPTDEVTALTWFDAGADVVGDLFDAVESATTVDLVPASDGTYAFSHQSAFELPGAVLEVVARSRVVFLPPVVFHDGPTATVEAVGTPEYLAAFYEEVGELLEARVRSVREFRRWPMPATVTERQRSALAAAVEAGYYEVPRTGGVADVAEALGCASSTAGELLRKAESAVVTAAVDAGSPGAPAFR